MSITCLPQGSSQYTHKSLLLWHRRDKIDQLRHPCPRTPPTAPPLSHPCHKAGFPAAWELSLNRVTTDLAPRPGPGNPCPPPSPQAECSGLLLLQGWGLGARGAHVYGGACSVQGCTHVRHAPLLPVPHHHLAESPCEVQEERLLQ